MLTDEATLVRMVSEHGRVDDLVDGVRIGPMRVK